MITWTEHSKQRCAQRCIGEQGIAFVLKHGRKIHRTGITFYFLGHKNIPDDLRKDDRFSKLEGTTLLVSPDGSLVTVYRNRRASRAIRKKAKCKV